MSEDRYLLPLTPVVIGFVISFTLIGASFGYFRSGGMIGAGILVFLLSVGLLFIIRNENETITDKGVRDWRDITDDDHENQRFEQQAERSMLVESGLADLDLVRTRLRHGTYLLRGLVPLAVLALAYSAWRSDLTTPRGLVILFAPYGIWAAYWGAVSILARSPNPEHRDYSLDPDVALMGHMKGAEAVAVIASLFYGVLGAGPMEYFRYRRVLADQAKEEAANKAPQ